MYFESIEPRDCQQILNEVAQLTGAKLLETKGQVLSANGAVIKFSTNCRPTDRTTYSDNRTANHTAGRTTYSNNVLGQPYSKPYSRPYNVLGQPYSKPYSRPYNVLEQRTRKTVQQAIQQAMQQTVQRTGQDQMHRFASGYLFSSLSLSLSTFFVLVSIPGVYLQSTGIVLSPTASLVCAIIVATKIRSDPTGTYSWHECVKKKKKKKKGWR